MPTNINTEFSDEEYKALNVAKAQANKDWHDFFLMLVRNNALHQLFLDEFKLQAKYDAWLPKGMKELDKVGKFR